MRKFYFLVMVFITVTSQLFAQQLDSTRLKLDYGSGSKDLLDYFRAVDVDYFKITSNDTTLRDYYFQIVIKEYWGSKNTKTDTLLKGNGLRDLVGFEKGDSTLMMSVLSRSSKPKKLKINYNLGRIGNAREYKQVNSKNYSMRDAINSHGKYVSVPLEKPFPLLVYSLPYEDPKQPGYLFYCALTADGTPPEKWGEVFGVKHYIIFEMIIRKR